MSGEAVCSQSLWLALRGCHHVMSEGLLRLYALGEVKPAVSLLGGIQIFHPKTALKGVAHGHGQASYALVTLIGVLSIPTPPG